MYYQWLHSLLLFCASIALCITQLNASVLITGKITDGNDKVLSSARIVLFQYTDVYRRQPLQNLSINNTSIFSVTVPTKGLYRLMVLAENHYNSDIPLFIENDNDSINITIGLGGYAYRNSFDSTSLKALINGSRDGIPMTLQSDGTFACKINNLKPQSFFVLTGAEISGSPTSNLKLNSISDTSHLLVFDPKQLIRYSRTTATVTFDAHHSDLAIFTITYLRQQALCKKIESIARQSGNQIKELKLLDEIETFRSELAININREKKTSLRELLVLLLAMPIPQQNLNSTYLKLIQSILPTQSQIWSLDATTAGYIHCQNDSLFTSFLHLHPNRLTQAKVITYAAFHASNAEKSRSLVNLLKEQYSDSTIIQSDYMIGKALQQFGGNSVIQKGKTVPSFEIRTLDQHQISSKNLLGKYYLIDFWATWCSPCIRELPNLHQLHEKFKDKLTIISISFDQSPTEITSFQKNKWKMPWVHAHLENGFNNPLAQTFQVAMIPRALLIDSNGVILAADGELRGQQLETTIQKYLLK